MIDNIVNDQIKWHIRKTLKDALIKRVKEGQPREKITIEFEEGYNNSIEEMKLAVEFLIKDGCLKKTENKDVFIITNSYYDYLIGNK